MVLSVFDLTDYTSLLDIQPLRRINSSVGYNYFLNGRMLGIGTENPTYELDVIGTIKCTILEMISDERHKSNIQLVQKKEILEIIKNVDVYKYTLNHTNTEKYGFIAQNINNVAPTVVNNTNDTKTVDVNQMVALCFACLKDVLTRLECVEKYLQIQQ